MIKKLAFLVTEQARRKGAYGGRGGSKSVAFADAAIFKVITEGCIFLCTREIQKSIKDSVYTLIESRVKEYGLEQFFEFTEAEIRCRRGGYFIFKGLRTHVIDDVKSIHGVKYVWIEEAQKVSQKSLDVLIPSIREEESEIWATWNTGATSDPVHQMFVVNPMSGTICVKVNYTDNPWFPDVLRAEMEHDKATDYKKYLHVWEGEPGAQGRYFTMFGDHMRCQPFELPRDAIIYGSLDYGESAPTSFGLWYYIPPVAPCPIGELHRMMTYYKKNLGADEHAIAIREAVTSFGWTLGRLPIKVYADPSIFAVKKWIQKDGMSPTRQFTVADIFQSYDLNVVKANNDRLNGWSITKRYMIGVDGQTKLFYWDGYNGKYEDLMPLQQHDEHRPEDIDTDLEDHIADDTRYICASIIGDHSKHGGNPEKKRKEYEKTILQYNLAMNKQAITETGW